MPIKNKTIPVQEIEARFGVLIDNDTKSELEGWVGSQQGVHVTEIVQWDVASRFVDIPEEGKRKLRFFIDGFSDFLTNRIRRVFPQLTERSKLRVRYEKGSDNDGIWSCDAKNNSSDFDQVISSIRKSLQDISEKIALLEAKEVKTGKDGKRLIHLQSRQSALTAQLGFVSLKKNNADIYDERQLVLDEKTLKAAMGKKITPEKFLEEISGSVTGLVHKVRHHIERTGFFLEAMEGIPVQCEDAAIDICLLPQHEGKFLTRLELEFKSVEALDTFFLYAHDFLNRINKVFLPLRIQFAFAEKEDKGQRTLAFEQYQTVLEEDPKKTSLSYWKSLQEKREKIVKISEKATESI